MCRGCCSSLRYSAIFWSESARPNQVFHQERNGISTMSHAVRKNNRRCLVDMRCRMAGDEVVSVIRRSITKHPAFQHAFSPDRGITGAGTPVLRLDLVHFPKEERGWAERSALS